MPAFEPGQKFRYVKDGSEPREYVLVDIAKLDAEVRNQLGAKIGDHQAGAVVLLKRTDKKVRKPFAAITPQWLLGHCASPGEWVPFT